MCDKIVLINRSFQILKNTALRRGESLPFGEECLGGTFILCISIYRTYLRPQEGDLLAVGPGLYSLSKVALTPALSGFRAITSIMFPCDHLCD